jgi:hypothetical protein
VGGYIVLNGTISDGGALSIGTLTIGTTPANYASTIDPQSFYLLQVP